MLPFPHELGPFFADAVRRADRAERSGDAIGRRIALAFCGLLAAVDGAMAGDPTAAPAAARLAAALAKLAAGRPDDAPAAALAAALAKLAARPACHRTGLESAGRRGAPPLG